ncbi:MAG: hypothetical protein Q4C42_05230 [Clostridia bacterium]|nr:hypothetical protein [Clostridia bacterium]
MDTATLSSTIKLNDKMSGTLSKINNGFKSLLSGMSKTADGINDFSDSVNSVSKGIGEFAGNLVKTAASIFSIQKAFEVFKMGIDYASDLSEVQNVVSKTFEDSEEAINSWAQTALSAYGLNEVSAKRYVGTMGAMLKSSGLSGDAVETMSKSITALSGDLASFHNLSSEDAFNKLRAGISGETEPLKQLGINMSVANLESYALSKGIETSYNAMSQAQQTALRYNYLMEATADAQGDFASTQDSYANQTKLLSENFTQFMGTIASSVIPILETALQSVNNVLQVVTNNWDKLAPVLGIVVKAIAAVVAVVTAWKIAQWALNASLAANPITWIIVGIIAIIGIIVTVVKVINHLKDTNISAMGVIVGAINTAVAFIKNLFVGLYNYFVTKIVTIQNLFAAFGNFFANFLNDPVAAAMNLLWSLADCALQVVQGVASIIDGLFGTNWAAGIENFRAKVEAQVEAAYPEEEVVKKWKASDMYLERSSYSDAYDSGYKIGENFGNNIEGILEDAMSFGDMVDPDKAKEVYQDVDWSGIEGTSVGDISDNTASIASNTAQISNDTKWLRELAEQDHIDKYTTAEIVVNFTSNANVTSTTDADSVFNEFSQKLQEAMEKSRAG